MEQHLKFSIKEQRRVDSLADLVYNLLSKKEMVEFVNKGGFKGSLDQKKIDFEAYDLFLEKKQIGHFEFELKNEIYECQIDLNGLPEDNYKTIIDSIKKEFPEVKI